MNYLLGGLGLAIGGAMAYNIVTDFEGSGVKILVGLAIFALACLGIIRATHRPEPPPVEKSVQRPGPQPQAFFVMPGAPMPLSSPYGAAPYDQEEYTD